ncbi:hypothetical protein SAMN05192574_105289 [Mucilaginibacter gossypiicola]|uniref:Uncharacterized protein n=1 Tax=Mucilaginibacter gossypiicola TaxID=551995 RepID=A0A1H8LXV2_9SPHI|nr:hypothetical protein [Mucilaginibacter gossypiicola]SEO09696.1 hypothetical protein SAMN05192574_105289 [Mucilaginibacter gossypiicola]
MENRLEINELFYVPLDHCPFSKRFIKKTRQLEFTTLKEIVVLGWVKLQRLEGFDYDCLNELIRFLEDRNQLFLLVTP